MKFFWLFSLAILGGIAVWVSLDEPDGAPAIEPSRPQHASYDESSLSVAQVTPSLVSPPLSESEPEPLFPENISRPQKWRLLDNYSYEVPYEDIVFINREGKVYPSYSMDALKELADQGDIKALRELAYRIERDHLDRLATYPEDFFASVERVKNIMTDVIVHGDRSLLSSSMSYMTGFLIDKDPVLYREVFLQKLAYYEFISLRGRYPEKYIGVYELIKEHEAEHGKLSLSAEEKIAIRAKAAEIYSGFESKRIEKGLGPFDNFVSDLLVQHADQAREEFHAELGDDAF